MNLRGQLTELKATKTFMFGGNATFTLLDTHNNERVTFRINVAKDKQGNKKDFFFVGVMAGPDNERSYKYIGVIEGKEGGFRQTTAAKFPANDKRVKYFNSFMKHIETLKTTPEHNLPEFIQIWHEGKCACCGKKLTVPESITTGFGSFCYKREIQKVTKVMKGSTPNLFTNN